MHAGLLTNSTMKFSDRYYVNIHQLKVVLYKKYRNIKTIKNLYWFIPTSYFWAEIDTRLSLKLTVRLSFTKLLDYIDFKPMDFSMICTVVHLQEHFLALLVNRPEAVAVYQHVSRVLPLQAYFLSVGHLPLCLNLWLKHFFNFVCFAPNIPQSRHREFHGRPAQFSREAQRDFLPVLAGLLRPAHQHCSSPGGADARFVHKRPLPEHTPRTSHHADVRTVFDVVKV